MMGLPPIVGKVIVLVELSLFAPEIAIRSVAVSQCRYNTAHLSQHCTLTLRPAATDSAAQTEHIDEVEQGDFFKLCHRGDSQHG